MNTKFLCDTNVVSELLKKKPDPKVWQWLFEQNPICISAITVEEIHYGLVAGRLDHKLEWFSNFLEDDCRIIPVTQEIAEGAGDLRGHFQRSGITRTQADLLIASTAKELNVPLATRNVKDFLGCEIPIFNVFENQWVSPKTA